MPKLYSTENVPLNEKIVQDHYFILSSDWWMFEFSPEERLFWGYACLNQDVQNSEAGYISLDELLELKVNVPIRIDGETRYMPVEVDRDTGWVKKPFKIAFEEYKRKHGIED